MGLARLLAGAVDAIKKKRRQGGGRKKNSARYQYLCDVVGLLLKNRHEEEGHLPTEHREATSEPDTNENNIRHTTTTPFFLRATTTKLSSEQSTVLHLHASFSLPGKASGRSGSSLV